MLSLLFEFLQYLWQATVMPYCSPSCVVRGTLVMHSCTLLLIVIVCRFLGIFVVIFVVDMYYCFSVFSSICCGNNCQQDCPQGKLPILHLLRGRFCLQCFETVGSASGRKLACNKFSDGVMAWLSVCSKVQLICMWSG